MSGMDRLAKQTADRTNTAFADSEAALLKSTSTQLESLRPQIGDKASFDALVAAVKASTAQNENIAQLQERLQKLGAGALAVAKEAATLIRPL